MKWLILFGGKIHAFIVQVFKQAYSLENSWKYICLRIHHINIKKEYYLIVTLRRKKSLGKPKIPANMNIGLSAAPPVRYPLWNSRSSRGSMSTERAFGRDCRVSWFCRRAKQEIMSSPVRPSSASWSAMNLPLLLECLWFPPLPIHRVILRLKSEVCWCCSGSWLYLSKLGQIV